MRRRAALVKGYYDRLWRRPFLPVPMRQVLTTMMTALLVAGGGFVLICALLYFSQERSIFFPRPNDAQLRELYAAQRIEIETGDAKLEGWWIENAEAKAPAVKLYF